MVNQPRSSHNTAPARRDVDNMTYNPRVDGGSDNAAYDDNTDLGMHPVSARGADSQPTNRDYTTEDKDTKRSEQSGQIPRREVDDLLSSTTEEERDVSSYTRGVEVDAYKQERDVDRALGETGIIDDE